MRPRMRPSCRQRSSLCRLASSPATRKRGFKHGDQAISGTVNLAHILHSGRVDETFSGHVVDELDVGGAAASPGHGWRRGWWWSGLEGEPTKSKRKPLRAPQLRGHHLHIHTQPRERHVSQPPRALSRLFPLNCDHPASRPIPNHGRWSTDPPKIPTTASASPNDPWRFLPDRASSCNSHRKCSHPRGKSCSRWLH